MTTGAVTKVNKIIMETMNKRLLSPSPLVSALHEKFSSRYFVLNIFSCLLFIQSSEFSAGEYIWHFQEQSQHLEKRKENCVYIKCRLAIMKVLYVHFRFAYIEEYEIFKIISHLQ